MDRLLQAGAVPITSIQYVLELQPNNTDAEHDGIMEVLKAHAPYRTQVCFSKQSVNILMVLTSHDRMGDTGQPTGVWSSHLHPLTMSSRMQARRSRLPRHWEDNPRSIREATAVPAQARTPSGSIWTWKRERHFRTRSRSVKYARPISMLPSFLAAMGRCGISRATKFPQGSSWRFMPPENRLDSCLGSCCPSRSREFSGPFADHEAKGDRVFQHGGA